MREILKWCLPALAIGLALRIVLCSAMPGAYYHRDSEQVFDTYRNLEDGAFKIHEKKTPLGPLLYCIPPKLHLPVLPTIAFVQHAVGLLLVVMVGAIVAKSFTWWRVFIIPITVVTAIDPILLWYEHVALPETFFVFSIVATAVTGLAYARKPTTLRLVLLGFALFLTAGFRPEGKLFLLFGLAMAVLMTWGRWKRLALSTAGMVALTALCFAMNATRQSGSLLFSNVAHLTPDSLKSAPGFAEAHREFFASLRAEWHSMSTPSIVRDRKQLVRDLRTYMQARTKDKVRSEEVNQLCGRIGYEICLRRMASLPEVAAIKFRSALRDPTAEDFGPRFVHREQTEALAGTVQGQDDMRDGVEASIDLARIAFSRKFGSRAEVEAHLREVYHPFTPDWLTAWQDRFYQAQLAWRLPDYTESEDPIPGMPVLFMLAVVGLFALACRHRELRGYHLAWLGMLLLMALVLTLTGSHLGRFRVGFEPFWILYAVALLDVLSSLWKKPAGKVG